MKENEALEIAQGLIEKYREQAKKYEILAIESGSDPIHYYYDGRSHAFKYAADLLEIGFGL